MKENRLNYFLMLVVALLSFIFFKNISYADTITCSSINNHGGDSTSYDFYSSSHGKVNYYYDIFTLVINGSKMQAYCLQPGVHGLSESASADFTLSELDGSSELSKALIYLSEEYSNKNINEEQYSILIRMIYTKFYNKTKFPAINGPDTTWNGKKIHNTIVQTINNIDSEQYDSAYISKNESNSIDETLVKYYKEAIKYSEDQNYPYYAKLNADISTVQNDNNYYIESNANNLYDYSGEKLDSIILSRKKYFLVKKSDIKDNKYTVYYKEFSGKLFLITRADYQDMLVYAPENNYIGIPIEITGFYDCTDYYNSSTLKFTSDVSISEWLQNCPCTSNNYNKVIKNNWSDLTSEQKEKYYINIEDCNCKDTFNVDKYNSLCDITSTKEVDEKTCQELKQAYLSQPSCKNPCEPEEKCSMKSDCDATNENNYIYMDAKMEDATCMNIIKTTDFGDAYKWTTYKGKQVYCSESIDLNYPVQNEYRIGLGGILKLNVNGTITLSCFGDSINKNSSVDLIKAIDESSDFFKIDNISLEIESDSISIPNDSRILKKNILNYDIVDNNTISRHFEFNLDPVEYTGVGNGRRNIGPSTYNKYIKSNDMGYYLSYDQEFGNYNYRLILNLDDHNESLANLLDNSSNCSSSFKCEYSYEPGYMCKIKKEEDVIETYLLPEDCNSKEKIDACYNRLCKCTCIDCYECPDGTKYNPSESAYCQENSNSYDLKKCYQIVCPGTKTPSVDFFYRPISLNDVFPNSAIDESKKTITKNRIPGSNWIDYKGRETQLEIESSGETILNNSNTSFNKNNPIHYSVTLTPSNMKQIRKYNDIRESESDGYADFTLECEESTGRECKSIFLTALISGETINTLSLGNKAGSITDLNAARKWQSYSDGSAWK